MGGKIISFLADVLADIVLDKIRKFKMSILHDNNIRIFFSYFCGKYAKTAVLIFATNDILMRQ